MGIFDNEDDLFNDDFMNYWEKFNNRMKIDEDFRNEMEKSDRDFQKLLKMFLTSNYFDMPLDFRIIPLNTPLKNDFGISENDMDIKNGIDENGEWESKNWTSPDGSISFSSFSRSSSVEDFGSGSKIRNRKPDGVNKKLKIAKLQKALDYVVEQENYEKASEIKKMIDELNSDTDEKE
jgi:hypothetical protein